MVAGVDAVVHVVAELDKDVNSSSWLELSFVMNTSYYKRCYI